MPARLTVYCKNPPARLDAVEVRRVLDAVEDWKTLAESFGVQDEAVVEAALETLAVEGSGEHLTIRYRPPEARQLEVTLSGDEASVRAACSEAREMVDAVQELGARQVFSHLDAVIGVVSIELGWGQLEDMGVVITNALAEHLARTCDGMIEDQNDDWWSIDDEGAPKVVVGPAWR